jgi:hypothetical protein
VVTDTPDNDGAEARLKQMNEELHEIQRAMLSAPTKRMQKQLKKRVRALDDEIQDQHNEFQKSKTPISSPTPAPKDEAWFGNKAQLGFGSSGTANRANDAEKNINSASPPLVTPKIKFDGLTKANGSRKASTEPEHESKEEGMIWRVSRHHPRYSRERVIAALHLMDHDEEKTGAQLSWFTRQPGHSNRSKEEDNALAAPKPNQDLRGWFNQEIKLSQSARDPNALDPNGLSAGKDALTGVSAQGEKEKGPDSVVCITLNAHSKMPFLTFNCVVVCRYQTQTF